MHTPTIKKHNPSTFQKGNLLNTGRNFRSNIFKHKLYLQISYGSLQGSTFITWWVTVTTGGHWGKVLFCILLTVYIYMTWLSLNNFLVIISNQNSAYMEVISFYILLLVVKILKFQLILLYLSFLLPSPFKFCPTSQQLISWEKQLYWTFFLKVYIKISANTNNPLTIDKMVCSFSHLQHLSAIISSLQEKAIKVIWRANNTVFNWRYWWTASKLLRLGPLKTYKM